MEKYIVQNIKLPIDSPRDEVFDKAKQRLLRFFSANSLGKMNIYKASIDARKKDHICFVYSVIAEVSERANAKALALDGIVSLTEESLEIHFGEECLSDRPIIVGFGPCGMFCGMLLAEHGYQPIIIERGASVEKRTEDVERFSKFGILNTESNIQFGAGGAGTFSDGKLVTRINDPKCGMVLSEMQKLGAPEEILYKAKPHIGTDYLKIVVSNMEKKIKKLGGEVLYDTKLEDIVFSNKKVAKIKTNKGEIACGALILALGHSARDTFQMLWNRGVSMIPKAFSVGVRIEHLQDDIDYALYGKMAGNPKLPKGEYNLSCHHGDRGVYTFCMCPGGQVVAAASEENGIVTNGMSNFSRNGENANSAVAVSVNPADYGNTLENAIAFQRNLERRAFEVGGKNYCAPCQTVGDFLGRTSNTSPTKISPTYRNGQVMMTDLNSILPSFVSESLRFGLENFDRKIRGFADDAAILTGVETRTSSPIRIPRNDMYLAFGFENIYPCGEGAGYAGGITSAAVDGIKCALAFMEKYKQLS